MLVSAITPILIRPLFTALTYLDQAMALGYNTTMLFVNKLRATDATFCDDPEITSTFTQAAEYIQNDIDEVFSWYSGVRDDLERCIIGTGSNLGGLTDRLKKVVTVKSVTNLIKDKIG